MAITRFILLFLVSLPFFLTGQRPVLHFDGSMPPPFFWQSDELDISVQATGFIGKAWHKEAPEQGLVLNQEIAPLNHPFTIIFWVQPYKPGELNTLLSQPLSPQSGDLCLKVQDHVFGLFDKNQALALANYPVDTFVQDWYQIGFVFDGTQHQLYLQGRVKFSSLDFPELSMLQAPPQQLTLLRGFAGVIDEVRYYNQALSGKEIKAIWQKDLQLFDKKTSTEKDIHQDFPSHTANRPNELAKHLKVTNNQIELEFWDYNHFDEDWVTIYRNAETTKSHSFLLPKKKNRRSIKMQFSETAPLQCLIFVAENMGLLPSENTIAYRIKGSSEIHQFAINRHQNAVLKLSLEQQATKQEELLPLVTTFTTQPILKIRCKKQKDIGDLIYFQMEGEEKPICLPLNSSWKELPLPLKFNQEQNLNFKGFLLGDNAKSIVEISLWDQDEQLVQHELLLSSQAYKLPIRHQSGKVRAFPDATIVLDRPLDPAILPQLELTISEDIKEDGDQLSVFINQQPLLREHFLSFTPKHLQIPIDHAQEATQLRFEAISFGSLGNCNPFVQVFLKGELKGAFQLNMDENHRIAHVKVIFR